MNIPYDLYQCIGDEESVWIERTFKKSGEHFPFQEQKVRDLICQFFQDTHFLENYTLLTTPLDQRQFIKLKEIGRGDFSQVYLAIDYDQQRVVALKEIKRMLSRECNTFANELFAFGVIGKQEISGVVHAYGVSDHLIVTRYYSGGDLSRHIDRKMLTSQDRQFVYNQIVTGLFFLHGKGLLHRDVKPENILVSLGSKGEVETAVLSDFGSSTSIEEKQRFWSFMSDVRHRPPEADLEHGEHNFHSAYDIWSLGITLLRMYGGVGLKELPWEEKIIAKEFIAAYALKRNIWSHPAFKRVWTAVPSLMEMCDPNPENRPSAKDLANSLI